MRLIDIFKVQNSLHAWLLDETRNIFRECAFEPDIYVYASMKELVLFQKKLEGYGFACSIQSRRTLKGNKKVLVVRSTVAAFDGLVRGIDQYSNFSFEIFNSGIPLPEYYMFLNGIFPTCTVSFDERNSKIIRMWTADSFSEEYELPCLKQAVISVETSHSLWKKSPPALLSIQFCNSDYRDISEFVKAFESKDPDVLLTENGSVELPFLLEKIREHHPDFSFSRFGRDDFVAEGKSYFSYGRMVYQNNGVYLKGRLHLEKKGVIYGRWNLWHDFELARACRTSLQMINHRSSGYGVTNLQLYHAVKKGIMVPQRTSCAELWRSGTELFNSDRGSLIYEPVIGFHTDVAEIDFISLFPSIMVRKNISTETLFCKCCPNNKVPGLDVNICLNEKGIIPEMLEPLIRQRTYYKSSGLPGHADRADALKGLLVTSFGYMGFRKSRFARIESHQAIQAYAREILLEASRIAEELGFSVVHGIVDSLWIKKPGVSKAEVNELVDEIRLRTGFESKIEGLYRWIVFLPSTSDSRIPVPTRYYGVFDNGEIKCRGIELRRHDTPRIIKELQAAVIADLANTTSYPEFRAAMIGSIAHIKGTISRILGNNIGLDELAITKSLSKTGYKSNTPQAIVIKKLSEQGIEPSPGQYIRYVITDRKSKISKNRYSVNPGQYDKYEYARLAKKSVENIFLPFIELSIEDRQPTLFEVLRNGDKGAKVEGLPLQVKERAC